MPSGWRVTHEKTEERYDGATSHSGWRRNAAHSERVKRNKQGDATCNAGVDLGGMNKMPSTSKSDKIGSRERQDDLTMLIERNQGMGESRSRRPMKQKRANEAYRENQV